MIVDSSMMQQQGGGGRETGRKNSGMDQSGRTNNTGGRGRQSEQGRKNTKKANDNQDGE